MMTVKIRRDNDPFKKYWWVILLAFAAVGGWICLPLMDSTAGGMAVREQSRGEQSLDSLSNPSGAPGQPALGMEGAYKKKDVEGPITSSLYQPPAETATASSTTTTEAAPATLAAALKAASQRAASADPSGWGGVKAATVFSPPHANFGALSGLGSGGSGSSAGASSFGGATAATGLSAFGSAKPDVGVAMAHGLGLAGPTPRGSSAMGGLNTAAAASAIAAAQRSGDAAASMGGRTFDGGGAGGRISGGGNSQGAVGLNGRLDGVPMNLKGTDPNFINQKTVEPPAAVPKDDPNANKQAMMQMFLMMAMSGLMPTLLHGIL